MIAPKRQSVLFKNIELRHIEPPAFRIGVFPYVKYFVNCVQRIDLKFIIGVTTVNKHLRIIFKP